MPGSKNRFLVAIALVLLLGLAVGAEVCRDALYGEPGPEASVMYIRSGEFLKRASVGNTALVADLYWLRAIQYFGGNRRARQATRHYELLYPMLDIVTTLDPDFTIVYRFGAIFLAEQYPDGPGRPDLSVALLEKGIRANPRKWQYVEDLGFVYYWWMHDYRKAAEIFERGARVPGAPNWMWPLAAVTYTMGGDRRTSRALWQQLLQTADNEWLRNSAVVRLAQLDALDQIDRLHGVVNAWKRRTGAPPASWQTLVEAGQLPAVPVDPSGTPFALDSGTGLVTVRQDSKLYPLPVEPGN